MLSPPFKKILCCCFIPPRTAQSAWMWRPLPPGYTTKQCSHNRFLTKTFFYCRSLKNRFFTSGSFRAGEGNQHAFGGLCGRNTPQKCSHGRFLAKWFFIVVPSQKDSSLLFPPPRQVQLAASVAETHRKAVFAQPFSYKKRLYRRSLTERLLTIVSFCLLNAINARMKNWWRWHFDSM